MNRMADTVIKVMDAKANEEEMKIRRYEMQRELEERREEEYRNKRLKDRSQECRVYLFKQMDEKKKREDLEKQTNEEQARIWETDRKNYLSEEKRV